MDVNHLGESFMGSILAFFSQKHHKCKYYAGESEAIPTGTSAVDDKSRESKHIAFMSSMVPTGEHTGIII
jgi:hypothetical protein